MALSTMHNIYSDIGFVKVLEGPPMASIQKLGIIRFAIVKEQARGRLVTSLHRSPGAYHPRQYPSSRKTKWSTSVSGSGASGSSEFLIKFTTTISPGTWSES